MLLAAGCAVLGASACQRGHEQAHPANEHDEHDHEHGADDHDHGGPGDIFEALDVPQAVRDAMGISFAEVQPRAIGQNLRLNGRFELLPSARREYRAVAAGGIELLVSQYARIEAGDALFRIASSALPDLDAEIEAAAAQVDAMGPLRQAHRVHEDSLARKVSLWEERTAHLEALRQAGAGNATQLTEALGTLTATQAELADVMEKDAQLEAEERGVRARLAALHARRSVLLDSTGCTSHTPDAHVARPGLTVCAREGGIVAAIAISSGAAATEGQTVLTIIDPGAIRLRASALQADLLRLRSGMEARIQHAGAAHDDAVDVLGGTIEITPDAHSERRTFDVIIHPRTAAPWARDGVWAQVHVALAQGESVLAVPVAAIARAQGRPILLVRDHLSPDRVLAVPVETGASDGSHIAVRGAIHAGDEVVIGGRDQLLALMGGSAPEGGHVHPDGTFHHGDHD